MVRTQLLFLDACGVSQQLISRRQVASRCGAFRPLEQLTSILLFSHQVLATSRSRSEGTLIVVQRRSSILYWGGLASFSVVATAKLLKLV